MDNGLESKLWVKMKSILTYLEFVRHKKIGTRIRFSISKKNFKLF